MGVPFWLVDDALGSGVDTRIGNRIEPMPQLGIQIVEVAEGAGKEEVLTNVAVRSLNLALGFGPIRAARLRLKAIVPGNIDEHVIVDNAARDCAFRRSRPGIPSEGGRLYRLKPAGDSDDPGHLPRRALVSTSSSGQLVGSASSL